jgi:hypothetical protein
MEPVLRRSLRAPQQDLPLPSKRQVKIVYQVILLFCPGCYHLSLSAAVAARTLLPRRVIHPDLYPQGNPSRHCACLCRHHQSWPDRKSIVRMCDIYCLQDHDKQERVCFKANGWQPTRQRVRERMCVLVLTKNRPKRKRHREAIPSMWLCL